MAQINKPNQYFNTVLYTGNASASRAITGVGFQPDWVWVKGRSTAYYHGLWDVVRTNKSALYSNATDAEDTTTGGTLTSFDSDGFTLPNVSGGFVNNSGTTYASWNWLANGTGSANTDGSISSTVSANTTSGFSIVSYTGNGSAGATVGHGLGAVPKMIIFKRRVTGGWNIYHVGIGNTKSISLNTTAATDTDTAYWNNTTPTSSVFSLGTSAAGNGSGNSMIAYCFAEKQGYSKFGSYTGNGSASSGTFVYTGFKPAFVMIKRTDTTGSWEMYDAKREGFNPQVHGLTANTSNAEDNTDDLLDLLSNGFKLYHDGGGLNASGGTYIYMAFAENPLVGTNNIPATAR